VVSPTAELQPDVSQPTVLQGQNKNIHLVISGGSANTPYTDSISATGPGGYIAGPVNGGGTFGNAAPSGSGIAPGNHDLVGLKIACDAPTGFYTATATVNTVDLGLSSYSPITTNADTFTVNPGLFLEDQTTVVSDLGLEGYGTMTCFSSTTAKNGKVNTNPGSLHIAAVVNTTGPCAGFGSYSGGSVTLTLPNGFKFDVTGASPAAHVYFVPAGTNGFDYHYPGPELAVPKPVVSGQSVTVDLSSVDVGSGPGVIPSNATIYVRAHAVFSASPAPADGTLYVFTTSTTANLAGIGVTTNASSQTITASSACIAGNGVSN
jgi:hypothetical protein